MAARRLLGQILKDLGGVHEGMVQEALSAQREKGGRIGEILLGLGHIDRAQLARALAEQAGLPFWDLLTTPSQPEALRKVDAVTARSFRILPLKLAGTALTVGLADPLNVSVLHDLSFTTGLQITEW